MHLLPFSKFSDPITPWLDTRLRQATRSSATADILVLCICLSETTYRVRSQLRARPCPRRVGRLLDYPSQGNILQNETVFPDWGTSPVGPQVSERGVNRWKKRSGATGLTVSRAGNRWKKKRTGPATDVISSTERHQEESRVGTSPPWHKTGIQDRQAGLGLGRWALLQCLGHPIIGGGLLFLLTDHIT